MSTISLTDPDTAGYVPDLSLIADGSKSTTVYRHFKGGYYVIVGFVFDAEIDRWKYGYVDAYAYRDVVRDKIPAFAPFTRTPENFDSLVPNEGPKSIRGSTHVPRFLPTPFTLDTLPNNKTLFD